MTFMEELGHLINKHCIESGSNTPDFLLAEYLVDCLTAYERASNAREIWYGTRLYPGKGAGVPSPK